MNRAVFLLVKIIIFNWLMNSVAAQEMSILGGYGIGDGPKSARLVYHKSWESRREPLIQSKNAELREMALRILYGIDEGRLYYEKTAEGDVFLLTSSDSQDRIHRIRLVSKVQSYIAGKDTILRQARAAFESSQRIQITKSEGEKSLTLILRALDESEYFQDGDHSGHGGREPYPEVGDDPFQSEPYNPDQAPRKHLRDPQGSMGHPPHQGMGHPPHPNSGSSDMGLMPERVPGVATGSPEGSYSAGSVGSEEFPGGTHPGVAISKPIGRLPGGDVSSPIGIPDHPPMEGRRDCLEIVDRQQVQFCVLEKRFYLEDYVGNGSYRLIIELRSDPQFQDGDFEELD